MKKVEFCSSVRNKKFLFGLLDGLDFVQYFILVQILGLSKLDLNRGILVAILVKIKTIIMCNIARLTSSSCENKEYNNVLSAII
jgi:hypothetical protein